MDAAHHVIPSLASKSHLSLTERELISWGESLGRAIHPPLLIALSGDLGTGKTTLAQAICHGYGVATDVTSPTYALVHEYSSRRSPVYHVDLYRLDREDELTNIGWDDVVSAHALVIVEWPERAGASLPHGHLPIVLDYLPGDSERRLLLAG